MYIHIVPGIVIQVRVAHYWKFNYYISRRLDSYISLLFQFHWGFLLVVVFCFSPICHHAQQSIFKESDELFFQELQISYPRWNRAWQMTDIAYGIYYCTTGAVCTAMWMSCLSEWHKNIQLLLKLHKHHRCQTCLPGGAAALPGSFQCCLVDICRWVYSYIGILFLLTPDCATLQHTPIIRVLHQNAPMINRYHFVHKWAEMLGTISDIYAPINRHLTSPQSLN